MQESGGPESRPRVGVFVDAENMSVGSTPALFRLLSQLRASVVCFRVYAQQNGQRFGAHADQPWKKWTRLRHHLSRLPIAGLIRPRLLQPLGIANAVDTALAQEALSVASRLRIDCVVICGGDSDYAKPIQEFLLRGVSVHWLMHHKHVPHCQREAERLRRANPSCTRRATLHGCDVKELGQVVCGLRAAPFHEVVNGLLDQNGGQISIQSARQRAQQAHCWDFRKEYSDEWQLVDHCIRAGSPWTRTSDQIRAVAVSSPSTGAPSATIRRPTQRRMATIEEIVRTVVDTAPSSADGWRRWEDVLLIMSQRGLRTRGALRRLMKCLRNNPEAMSHVRLKGNATHPDFLLLSADQLIKAVSKR
jgi:hypothetical protein